MKVARSSTPSNQKNCGSAHLIPLTGNSTSFCANTRTEPAILPTNSADEAKDKMVDEFYLRGGDEKV